MNEAWGVTSWIARKSTRACSVLKYNARDYNVITHALPPTHATLRLISWQLPFAAQTVAESFNWFSENASCPVALGA